MKKKILFMQAALLSMMVSCNETDNTPASVSPATSQQFAAMQKDALSSRIQRFTFNTSNPSTSFTSSSGVEVFLDTTCLTRNGQPVTGTFTVEYVEIFDRGNMLITKKPTMGVMSDGTQSLLISGGEIYVNAVQDGVALQTSCGFSLSIPTALTGGPDDEMTTFTGTINSAGDFLWNPAPMEMWIGNDEQTSDGPTFYNGIINNFGWFNCDKFASFTGPKTDIGVTVPAGYNVNNSEIFIAVEGEPNTLGTLFGIYPIGLYCHIIFVTGSSEGNWRYAIKSVTLSENAAYTFTEAELQTATPAQFVAAINNLP